MTAANEPEAATEDGAHEEPRLRTMLTERMVLDLVPVSRTTLHRLERAGKFPRSIYVSPNRRFWFRDQVIAWQAAVYERDQRNPDRKRGRGRRPVFHRVRIENRGKNLERDEGDRAMATDFCGVCSTRRTKADIAAIRDTIIEVIEADPPMTVRQVFYQLVALGVIEKSEQQYQGTVIRLMTEMRLSGELPYKWVVDESRRVRITQTYDNVEDAIEQTAEFYRRSALAQSASYIEIWSEKDALAGAMSEVTEEYDVPLMVSRGMPSLTFLHGSALEIKHAAENCKRSFIYQFGDHDPSGVLIPKTIERRLTEMCEGLGCSPPTVKRVALTEAQNQVLPTSNPTDQARPQRPCR